MGTHISRVKSVDLDSWTDEQMASILAWGNARANKYFEAKLAPGHVPSESKIENFIRTKYEIKRWAMEGPRPDPSTLGADGDDDVPLSVVKEKQNIDRSESVRKTSGAQPPVRAPAPQADLLGGVDSGPPRASSATPTSAQKVPPKAEPAPPKATQSNSSLLGLDFFGEPSAPQRPASTTGVSTQSGGQSRPDLKQSILSLYATAPKPQPQQQPQHQQQGSFGGMTSPGFGHQQQSSQGGFTDAFSNLSMSNTTSPPAAPAPADPFASFGTASRSPPPPKPAPASNNSFGGLGGGSFFDSKPAQPAAPAHQKKPSNGGFGDFGSFASPAAPVASKPAPAQSASADLFDFASPVSTTSPPPPTTSPPVQNSVFNLSQPQQPAAPPQQSPPKQGTAAPAFSGMSGADVWGNSEWATPEPAPAVATPSQPPVASTPSGNEFGGWGSGTGGGSFASTPIVPGAGGGFTPAPKVTADEEFGGWASSTGASNNNSTTATSKPAGGFAGADDDLFSNVWQ